MSKREKVILILMLALLSSIAPLGIDMYLPALPQIADTFKTSEAMTQFSLASFFIAFALGQLIYGPISDIYGRKKPLYVGVGIFIISSIGCVLVNSIELFIALRFLEALGGCAGAVIARAIVNDRFSLNEAASVFALIGIVSSVVPMISPSIGAIVLEFFPWEGIFIAIFGVGFVVLGCTIIFLKESAPNSHKTNDSINQQVISAYKEILKNKYFIFIVFSLSIAFSSMFAYVASSSFVFLNHFELSARIYGALFALNALGITICSAINSKIVLKIAPQKIVAFAFSAMCAFSGLIAVAEAMFESVVIFEIMLFCTIACLGFLMPNLTSIAMGCARAHSGTASAILGCLQFGCAGLMSFLAGELHATTPFAMALLMCAGVVIAAFLFVMSRRQVQGLDSGK